MLAAILIAPPGYSQGNQPYLALGDSIPFGLNPLQLPPLAPVNLDNFKGYPVPVAAATGLRLVNASRVAETSTSMVSGLQADRLPYPPWNPAYPVFVPYSGSQANFAVNYLRANRNTRLVTISIGGNDLGLLLFQCGTNQACLFANLSTTLSNVGRNLSTVLRRIRQEADYRGPIVVLTYYAFNYADFQTLLGFVSLNAVLSSVTALYGGQTADGFGAFLVASASNRGDACAAGLLIRLPTGCDTHPTPMGHQVLSRAILNAYGR